MDTSSLNKCFEQINRSADEYLYGPLGSGISYGSISLGRSAISHILPYVQISS
jgi:hypothetical protein